jgi:phosphatidylinositol glycan class C protein
VPPALPAALPLRRRKVLYEKQAVEDDHTDEHFLEELVLNLDVRPRSYWVVVRGSVGVTQQLSVTVGAALVFFFVNEGALSPDALLCLDGAGSAASACACPALSRLRAAARAAALLACGFALRCALGSTPRRGAAQSAREGAVLAGGVYALSPLMQTLTGSISGDTIAACVAASLVLHLYLHDYSTASDDVTQTIGGSLSLGAAMFASVLLASRLPTPAHVFALLMFALQAFVAWPFLRRDLARASRRGQLALAVAMHGAALRALARVSPLLAAVHAAALLFITFVCPWSLVRCHKLKRRINGCALHACAAYLCCFLRALRGG